MRRAGVALFGAAVAVCGALVYSRSIGPIDDALISLRAARNWAHGLGPVFNAGERVEATTSPLWVAVLAVLPLPAASLFSAGLAGAATALVAFELEGTLAALFGALLLAALPAFSAWAVSGMETPLAAGLLALAAFAGLRGRGLWAGVVLALAVLARPEAIVALPALLFGIPREKRLQALIACGALVLAHLLARHAYYGAWLPNTYVAKTEGGGLALRLRGLRYAGAFVLAHAALFVAIPRRRFALAMALSYVAAVAWEGGDHFSLGRLAVPVLPLVCASFAAGLTRRTAALALAVAIAFSFESFDYLSGGVRRLREETKLTQEWAEIGRALQKLPAGTVAVVPIGAIGVYSGRPILDLVGLADAHIARSRRLAGALPGHEHSDVAYVLQRAPELVLANPVISPAPRTADAELRMLDGASTFASAAELVRDPEFQRRYAVISVPAGGGFATLWQRK